MYIQALGDGGVGSVQLGEGGEGRRDVFRVGGYVEDS